MSNYKLHKLSVGDTGGHKYPAISIANKLKVQHSGAEEHLFVGVVDRVCKRMVEVTYRNTLNNLIRTNK